MGKFGVKDVFDLEIYDKDGLRFKIETMSEMCISRDFDKKENTLIVEDALLDSELLKDVLNGEYDNRYLRISGNSTFRDLECKDYGVELNIAVAKLIRYSFPMGCCNSSVITLEFAFPTKDYYGFQNAMVNIKNSENCE